MAVLTAKQRNKLPKEDFAGPDESYPVEDKAHARNALSRVSQNGSPELKKRVRAKVKAKYPGIKQENDEAAGEVTRRLEAKDRK